MRQHVYIHALSVFFTFFATILGAMSVKAEVIDGYAKISDDLTIHYQTAGTGKIAIVFIPGWTMSTKVFEHQLSHFENSSEFTAISYDPRAQGLSSMTVGGHYYEQRARDLNALLDHLKIERFVLVPWSAGGGDALEYLRVFGDEKAAGLLLLDTAPKVRTTDYTKEWAWYGTKDEGDQDGYFRLWSYDLLVNRDKFNDEFIQWMLEDPSAKNTRFVKDITNRTPDSIGALINTSYWFLDNTKQVEALNGVVPLLFVTRTGGMTSQRSGPKNMRQRPKSFRSEST